MAALALLAVLSAAMFAGGALYISFVEHPARMRAGPAVAIAQFRQMYPRAAPWQAGTAALSLLAGLALASLTGSWRWAAGGLLVGSAIPLTLIVIMPTNRRLLAPGPLADVDAVRLLDRWGRLHAVRSAQGALGLLAFLHAALWP